MAMQSEPLKTGFLVTEIDGSPEDLPVKLRFPNGSVTRTQSNELSVNFVVGSPAGSETDPLSLHLAQASPQTMTGLADGYLKLTSGVIGTGTVDLSTLVPYTGATTAVTLGAHTLSTTSGVITPKIYPAADSTTALTFLKADGVTALGTWDTTNGRFGIGETAPSQALDLIGSLELQATTTATTGVIYKGASRFIHDFAGTVGGNTFVGLNSGNFTMTGSNNSAIGAYTLYSNTSGTSNVAIGYQALAANTTGNYNNAIGNLALVTNTTGANNTGIGAFALRLNTTGSYNIANGHFALRSNTTGNNNNGIGYAALFSNTSGANNTGIGYQTLYANITGSNNTANGYLSLNQSNSNDNTAIGNFALYNLAGAYSDNTALGSNAGLYQADGVTALTSPSQSLYLGSGAMGFNNSDVNSIVIGYLAKGIGANSVVLGNDSITTTALKGSVGIGTTAPTAYLTIKAGTATANTAPLKFTSGTLNTTAEAGAVEFLTDAFYGTITTGAARKTFAFLESPIFTGKVTVGASSAFAYKLLVAEDGITPEDSAVITTDAMKGRTVSVQGNGAAYFMGRDVTNNIEFIMGTSSAGAAFVGSMTSHPLHLRINNVTKLSLETSGLITLGSGVAGYDQILKFDGETNDGLITWMEDEDYFLFGDDIVLENNENMTLSGTGTVTAPNIVSTGVTRLKGYTVGTLPAGTQGDTAFCTDLLTPTFLTAAVGGGAIVGPVFYNGAAWVSY